METMVSQNSDNNIMFGLIRSLNSDSASPLRDPPSFASISSPLSGGSLHSAPQTLSSKFDSISPDQETEVSNPNSGGRRPNIVIPNSKIRDEAMEVDEIPKSDNENKNASDVENAKIDGQPDFSNSLNGQLEINKQLMMCLSVALEEIKELRKQLAQMEKKQEPANNERKITSNQHQPSTEDLLPQPLAVRPMNPEELMPQPIPVSTTSHLSDLGYLLKMEGDWGNILSGIKLEPPESSKMGTNRKMKGEKLKSNVPAACRSIVKNVYRELVRRHVISAFDLHQSQESPHNVQIYWEVIEHIKKTNSNCLWSESDMLYAIRTYWRSLRDDRQRELSGKKYNHRRMIIRREIMKRKLKARQKAMTLVKWNPEVKTLFEETLTLDYMSSEEEDNTQEVKEGPKPRVVRKIPWESEMMTKCKANLDAEFKKICSARQLKATAHVYRRPTVLSCRSKPPNCPQWAVDPDYSFELMQNNNDSKKCDIMKPSMIQNVDNSTLLKVTSELPTATVAHDSNNNSTLDNTLKPLDNLFKPGTIDVSISRDMIGVSDKLLHQFRLTTKGLDTHAGHESPLNMLDHHEDSCTSSGGRSTPISHQPTSSFSPSDIPEKAVAQLYPLTANIPILSLPTPPTTKDTSSSNLPECTTVSATHGSSDEVSMVTSTATISPPGTTTTSSSASSTSASSASSSTDFQAPSLSKECDNKEVSNSQAAFNKTTITSPPNEGMPLMLDPKVPVMDPVPPATNEDLLASLDAEDRALVDSVVQTLSETNPGIKNMNPVDVIMSLGALTDTLLQN